MTPLKPTLLILAMGAGVAFANSHAMPGAQFLSVWDLDADGTATLAELQEMRGIVFAMFDSDADGTLNTEEYRAFDETRAADLANFEGPDPARERMQMVADGLGRAANDADGNGRVTRDEFIAGTHAWLEQIDRDGNGVVTSADFMR
ncbi:EF hand domain protein [Roseibacterium elongatum DSM 19469]|uniref:EF hand domain protein n=1 Tax=Roseicyclus elongatus DSM 19469 TaxID=1294273 RepID=W8S5H8_9RHOB|nr:EF-hand domain-containing protein [Roseibacterium elongatum]AHM05462.1 EF hand domain protein [Roseibacterium elongatum DSM 19469]